MEWTEKLLRDIVEWDVSTWRKAIFCWDRRIDGLPGGAAGRRALEIGARGGGVTMYLARKGFDCVCSDRGETFADAKRLHAEYGVSDRVAYADADAAALPFEDAGFDVVAFKSVLGSVGKNRQDEKIDAAMAEALRVLKPGGMLLFAENLKATRVHLYLRRRLNRWGSAWNYLSLERMRALLAPLEELELHTYGFWGCFWKDHPLTRAADALCCRRNPSRRHYMCYGAGTKPETK